jgi:hypothetical protein
VTQSGLLKKILLAVPAILCAGIVAAAQQPAPNRPSQRGEIVLAVACAAQPNQTYALYLPSAYTPERRWPIVYVFEPFARGSVPLKLMSAAAERYGYVLVASNNARNGAIAPELEAADAVWKDTRSWLAIDDQRIYFAGLSGAARLASQLALNAKAAGVFLNSAGFSGGAWPAQGLSLAVFGAVGLEDFNYPEMIELDAKLDSLGLPHFLRRFSGPHGWAPAEVWEEAFAWMDLQAMRQGRKPVDPSFVSAELARAMQRERSFEDSRELFFAWHDCREISAAFVGLVESPLAADRARALEKDPEVAAGRKRDAKDIESQRALQSEILATLGQLRDGANPAPASAPAPPQSTPMGTIGTMGPMGQISQAPRPTGPDSVGGPASESIQARAASQIRQLRQNSTRENKPEKKRVLLRALSGVAVYLEETGDSLIAKKQFRTADFYLELGVEAVPDWPWSHLQLARSYALEGSKKNALRELRRVRELTTAPAAFAEQLRSSDFDRLRDDPDFRALAEESLPHAPPPPS